MSGPLLITFFFHLLYNLISLKYYSNHVNVNLFTKYNSSALFMNIFLLSFGCREFNGSFLFSTVNGRFTFDRISTILAIDFFKFGTIYTIHNTVWATDTDWRCMCFLFYVVYRRRNNSYHINGPYFTACLPEITIKSHRRITNDFQFKVWLVYCRCVCPSNMFTLFMYSDIQNHLVHPYHGHLNFSQTEEATSKIISHFVTRSW